MRVKRCIAFWVVLLLAGSTSSLWAQSGIKIGFLLFSRVLESTEESKIEIQEAQSFVADKQSESNVLQTDLNKLKQTLANQQRALNPETVAEMTTNIADKETELKRFNEDVQRDIDKRRNTLFGRLSKKIQDIVNDYARQNNYGAILYLDQLQGYFDPSMDLTQTIIDIYNEKYPPEGPAAGTP